MTYNGENVVTILVAPFSMLIIFAGYEDNYEFDYGPDRTVFLVKKIIYNFCYKNTMMGDFIIFVRHNCCKDSNFLLIHC